MRYHGIFFLLGWLLTGSAFAACDALPWKFGMSQKEVAAIAECGPYRSFSNGDLETYKGVFEGKEENFQFFFDHGRLRRIGVYLYEGNDPAAAARTWSTLYHSMERLFGAIETPGNTPPEQNEAGSRAFAATAQQIVQASGKAQMAPLSQTRDAFVFSSFMRRELNGVNYYYVILYFDGRVPKG